MWEWLRALLLGENRILAGQAAMETRLNHRFDELKGILVSQQDQINALTEQVGGIATTIGTVVTALGNVRQDIADLKAANPTVDLSALEASVAGLGTAVDSLSSDVTELDDENPAVPPPAPEPA